MRTTFLLVTLSLLISCGKVVDPNAEQGPAGAAVDSFGGRSAIEPSLAAGRDVGPVAGSGATGATTPPVKSNPPASTEPPAIDADGGSDMTPPKPGPAADGGMQPSEPLCNGSSEIRLAYTVSGGFVDQYYGFTNPRGSAYFAVDGMCQFYAGGNYMKGIATGRLTPAQVDELTSDVHWNELAGWTWSPRVVSCADGGSTTLSRRDVSAVCVCSCEPEAPKGLNSALDKAYAWSQRLLTEGTPIEGSVSAIALPSHADNPTLPAAWPLTPAMKSIPHLLQDGSNLWNGAGPWARFDGSDAVKLRKLRVAAMQMDTPGTASVHYSVLIEDGPDNYDLFVRDELPDSVAQAWDTLNATLPKP